MKYKLILSAILLWFFASCKQDAKEILKKSFDKCQKIQNGYYEMTRFSHDYDDTDTSVNSYKCFFNKIQNDSLSSSAFHIQEFYRKPGGDTTVHSREYIYTGAVFVNLFSDSTAVVIDKSKWANRVATSLYQCVLFSPFTDKLSSPLLNANKNINLKTTFNFIGVETVNGDLCYHVEIGEFPESEVQAFIQTLSVNYHVWIRKSDDLPIQYSSRATNLIEGDTVVQYERFLLTRYELNQLRDQEFPTLKNIPSFFEIHEFQGINKQRNLL